MINLMHDCIPKYDSEYKRISKDEYYLEIAETVAKRSTCLRTHYGSVIVKNDRIVSTGYNGAPHGRKNPKHQNQHSKGGMIFFPYKVAYSQNKCNGSKNNQ